MGEKKFNIPMCAALILLLLTMISIHLTSGLYARYTVTATASDSARVARFDVRSEVQPVAGEEGKFSIKVTNASEVAVSYRVDVVFAESLEEGKLAKSFETEDDDEADWLKSYNLMIQKSIPSKFYNEDLHMMNVISGI